MLGLLAGGASSAQDSTAEAKEHFHAAANLYREARYKEAIDEFQTAYRLHPHGVIFFNLAQCYERLGDIPAALRSYREYLRQVPAADDRQTVEAAIKNLGIRLQQSGATTLFVYSLPAGASVSIDGQLKGVTPFSADLSPGSHLVTVELSGYATISRSVEAAAGKQVELDLTLDKGTSAPLVLAPDANAPPQSRASSNASSAVTSTAPPAPEPSHTRVWTWVAGGVAVAGAASGIIFGEMASSNANTLHQSPHQRPQVQNLYNTANTDALVANVSYAVAGVAAVGGVGAFFIEGSF